MCCFVVHTVIPQMVYPCCFTIRKIRTSRNQENLDATKHFPFFMPTMRETPSVSCSQCQTYCGCLFKRQCLVCMTVVDEQKQKPLFSTLMVEYK